MCEMQRCKRAVIVRLPQTRSCPESNVWNNQGKHECRTQCDVHSLLLRGFPTLIALVSGASFIGWDVMYTAAECETDLPNLLDATTYLLSHLSQLELPLYVDQSPAYNRPGTESVLHESADDKL